MSGEGFVLNVGTMTLFFRFCHRYKIEDRDKRIDVLRRLVAKKRAKYIRDPKEFMQGKSYIEVRKKRESQ